MISHIAFDQYQRYKNAQIAVDLLRKDDERFKILEVGANEHRNLEKFLQKDDIVYVDKNMPEELLENERFIRQDACNMEFEDDSFDIVIALDVYEHIPNEKKYIFLDEIKRVSKYAFILGAPFYSKENEFAESMLNYVFLSYFNQDYIWLKEHLENKLPDIEMTKTYLNKNIQKYYEFSHADVFLWQKMMKAHFKSVEGRTVLTYLNSIDRYYNENIFCDDYFPKKPYRNFFVCFKQKDERIENIRNYFESKRYKKNQKKIQYLDFMLNEFDDMSLREHMDINMNVSLKDSLSLKTEITNNISNLKNITEKIDEKNSENYRIIFDNLREIIENIRVENSRLLDENKDFKEKIFSTIEKYEKKIEDIENTSFKIKQDCEINISKTNEEKDIVMKQNDYLTKRVNQLSEILDNANEKLLKKQEELNNIYSSRGWKYLTKIKRLFAK